MSVIIKPGDLVMLVRACCQAYDSVLGSIRVVAEVVTNGETLCRHCMTANEGRHVVSTVSTPCGAPYWWYRKIPPLENLEGQRDSSGLDERKKRPTPEEFEAELKRWQARMT